MKSFFAALALLAIYFAVCEARPNQAVADCDIDSIEQEINDIVSVTSDLGKTITSSALSFSHSVIKCAENPFKFANCVAKSMSAEGEVIIDALDNWGISLQTDVAALADDVVQCL